ncbi:hypothetical protein [Plastoroseomonas arctica]|uniref:Lipoprotein n=1 Tax=Plastoroseomonas arctica TaxID=1509237 RepID=A0AAF1JX10_9PROT|nr:hypothetical protein [Plastoroseomonas arctica]MBR0655741.1 hypothetical protein [Plastoroseomonas arctica]
MIRRQVFAALAVLGSLGLAGCVVPQTAGQGAQYVQPIVQQVPRQACDTRFTVVNQSNVTVRELYFSSSRLASFGVDQLGQRVLQPGQSMNFVAANPGGYDFRVVWVNGRRADLMNVDVCQASRITVTNRGMVAQ